MDPASVAEEAMAELDPGAASPSLIAAACRLYLAQIARALRLRRALRDLEKAGLLAEDPADVVETLTAEMRDEVHALAPRMAAWLKRIGGGVVSRDSTLQDLGISREAGRTGPLFAGGAE